MIRQEAKAKDSLSVAQMCETLEVSRVDYYRGPKEAAESDADLALREKIQAVALEMSAYGYRRITAELRRRGVEANHKRVLRLMREDNLLCLGKRKFIRTTDSNHSLATYPNLAGDMRLSRVNELWVSDITYIRLLREFIYLAVILDAYSRRCIGWALGLSLQSSLAYSGPQNQDKNPTTFKVGFAPFILVG
jgi:putative transposase